MTSVTFCCYFLVDGNQLILPEVEYSMYLSFRGILELRIPLGVMNAIGEYFISYSHTMEMILK